MAMIEAVTISGLLGDIGTFAGIAAALGVAILSMVIFAQGREMARLRDLAADESDRAYAAEAALAAEVAAASRLAREGRAPVQVDSQSPAAQPQVAVAAAAIPAAAAVVSFQPAGAPALGSATPAPGIAEVLNGQPEHPSAPSLPEPESVPVSQPTQSGPAPIVIPSPSSAAAARTDSPSRVVSAPSTPAAGAAARTPRPPVAETSGKRRRSPLPAILGTIVVLGVAVLAVSMLSGSDSSKKSSSQGNATGNTTGVSGMGAVVAVLNGTPVSGLAGQVAAELKRAGYKQGAVSTARDQQRQVTVVAYMPGHMSDAEAVAKALGVSAPVAPADDAAQSVACPNPTTCTAEVIVTVGADRTR